nr:Xaa-Pro aminopeptidase [Geodermatophilaceae bacterium]
MSTRTHPLPIRAQAAQIDRWLDERLHTVLPALLDRAGIDTWIVSAREYHEDPVMAALLPGEWHSARRRTILVLHRTPDGVDAEAVARYPVGTAYTPVWQGNGAAAGGPATETRDPETGAPETQWEALRRVVAARDPRRIGLDTSSTFALADGLSATEERAVLAALGPLAARVASAEAVAIGLLETRLPAEIEAAHELNALAHTVIADAYAAVTVGTTTALDVAWWIDQRFADLGTPSWFRATVDVQRRGVALGAVPEDAVVLPGDLLHCDVGLVSCRLHTDTQQNAYVLQSGETTAPRGLVDALTVGNRMQDLTCAALTTGGTGND